MKATIYSQTEVIGIADLKVIDDGMGVLSGQFQPSENYERIRESVWNFNESEKKDFHAWENFRLNVQLSNGYFLFPLGGISILDVRELRDEPIEIVIAGVDRHVIEDYFIRKESETILLEPWGFINIKQKIAFEDELGIELGRSKRMKLLEFFNPSSNSGHQLFGSTFSAVANTGQSDDVLFAINKEELNANFAVVHLTWKGKVEISKEWPATKLYDTFDEFKNNRMQQDNFEWES